MSETKRSFWASVPGLVTGITGLLTGVVGLVAVLIQLDVIGGDGASDRPATTATTLATSGTTPSTEVGSFTVIPDPLTFGPTDPKVKTVTVKNTSATVSISLQPPKVTGDTAQFSAAFDTCSSAPITAGLSCTVKVTFSPSGALGNYKATLQIQPASGAVRADEVALSGSTLLGG